MVSVVELVDTPDCGSGAAALRVQVSSLTPYAVIVQLVRISVSKTEDMGSSPTAVPANEASSVLLSSCGGASRFGVNRLLARRIDTALKTKTLIARSTITMGLGRASQLEEGLV